MATFEESIDSIENMLDDSWGLPMTGKCIISGEAMRERIKQLRINYPAEIKRAKAVLDERERILTKATAEAEQTVSSAQKKAAELLDQQAILVEAKAQANEIMRSADEESARMRRAAVEFVNNILSRTEDHYENALSVIRQAKRSMDGADKAKQQKAEE